MKKLIIAGLVVLATAGCGSAYDQLHEHNTPVGGYVAHPNTVIEFPYNWDNVIRVCDHGNGIYEPRGSAGRRFRGPS